MNADLLEAVWQSLSLPDSPDHLDARELAVSDVWVAQDQRGLRHLLVLVPDGSELAVSQTHGLQAVVAGRRIPGRGDATYVDLTCVSEAMYPKFSVVAADLVADLDGCDAAHRIAQIVATLTQWRWFWDVDPELLSVENAVGLFGELWFLSQWAKPDGETIAAWEASDGARHDFQWPAVSVEVKTTSKAGPVRHRISPLSQLEDPESGSLFLFSLRVSRDRLARNTLGSLVDAISASLASQPEAKALFLSRLSSRGFTPANRGVAAQGYRVVGEALYAVTDDFPRLREATLSSVTPPGVGGISYELDMDACQRWLKASSADQWPLGGV